MFAMLQPFIFPSMPALKFAIKLSIAAALALWIAFVFDLAQPQWAAATAVIVSQPHSGMVVSKGLARLLGTILGTIMALVITALFSQTPWLFLLSLAVGLTICTAASTVIRSAWAYSFVLAGYTTAIIVLPDLYKPLSIFDYAIARCTEICLGIICASLVSALLWPRRIHHELVSEAFNTWQAGLASACSALKGDIVDEELLDSLSKIVAVDAQREHAAFEGQDGRNRAKAIQGMSRDILGLLRAARGVARQWRFLPKQSKQQLQPWFDECLEVLSKPTHRALSDLTKRLYEVARRSKDLEQQDILARLELVTYYAASAGLALSAVRSGHLKKKISASYLSMHRDYSLGIFFGLRTGLAFLVLCIMWLLWAWPLAEASGALMMVAVTCSLFANRENAAQISMGFLRGICYAVVVAFVVSQLIIPSWNGFPLLWLAIGVPLFFSSLGMVIPSIAGTCTIFSINIVMLCKPGNYGFQSTEAFINQAMAMPLGIVAAVIAFNLISINTSYWQGKYLLGAILRDLKKLTYSSLGGAETWFGGRMADRLILLARHKKIMDKNATERWADALYAMDMGDELLYLRACLAKQQVLSKDLEKYLEVLANVFEQGPAVANADLLEQPSMEFKTVIREQNTDGSALLALSSIKQLQQIWQQWCQQQKESNDGVA